MNAIDLEWNLNLGASMLGQRFGRNCDLNQKDQSVRSTVELRPACLHRSDLVHMKDD